ncbi:MAG: hypothetical protein KIS83_13885 [Rubrivivax sp.]|nr:hypothetical protein [Rubrivivax sp.]
MELSALADWGLYDSEFQEFKPEYGSTLVNAEVPEGYRASFGRIQGYQEPVIEAVRIDSGIDAQSDITPHYDSMLGKAIAFEATRAVARDRLARAVREWRIQGIQANQPLLGAILGHPRFNDVLATNFLAQAFPAGWAPDTLLQQERRCAAAAAWFFAKAAPPAPRPLESLTGFRLSAALRPARCVLQVGDGDGLKPVQVDCMDPRRLVCHLGESRHELHLTDDGGVATADRRYRAVAEHRPVGTWCDSDFRDWTVLPDVESPAGSAGSNTQRRRCFRRPAWRAGATPCAGRPESVRWHAGRRHRGHEAVPHAGGAARRQGRRAPDCV